MITASSSYLGITSYILSIRAYYTYAYLYVIYNLYIYTYFLYERKYKVKHVTYGITPKVTSISLQWESIICIPVSVSCRFFLGPCYLENHFQCSSTGRCIDKDLLCDGFQAVNCGVPKTRTATTRYDDFICSKLLLSIFFKLSLMTFYIW